MNKLKNKSIAFFALLFISINVSAAEIVTIKHSDGDMTLTVRKALESVKGKDVKVVFEKGKYLFLPDYAQDKYCYITNHGNGLKKIIFRFEGLNSVEIEGNGSEFIFHGQVAPFQFYNCEKVTVKNITIDWDIPFSFQGEVVAVNEKEGYRDLKPYTNGFSWTVQNNKLKFPNIDGFTYNDLGNTLAFDKEFKRVAHGAWDMDSEPYKIEKLKNGNIRFYEKLKNYPAVGTVLHSKGPHNQNRYAPAFQTVSSKNCLFENIVIHHALGMGFLFERTEDIVVKNSGIYVREGSDRVVSATADATHFANCKGDILVENCTFKHMLDDGTNVHGTYVEVDKIIDNHTVVVGLKHYEQLGFEFAGIGDEVWFILNPSPKRADENVVTAVKVLNDHYTELTFKNEIPSTLKTGDIIENKTWNPNFTMRGCTIKDHRARNVIIKTPKKIIIENNKFSSMMSAILFRGETFYWFESGAVEDVVIRNNEFKYTAYSGAEHAIMYVTPRLGATFNQTELFDRNIRFENNTIETFDNRIIWADRADGLVISGNKIIKLNNMPSLYPNAPIFQLDNCNNVQILNNSYMGAHENTIVADEKSRKLLKIKGNKGFKNLK